MMLVLGGGSGVLGQIAMDGAFNDWTDIAGWTDPTGPEGSVDLLEMKATHDAEYLYVYLRLGADLDLTDALYPHNLFLLIDADMDAATGFTPRPGFGSELGIDFNDLFAYYDVVPATTANFSEIGFHPAPTVTSSEFEIALRRDAVPDGVHPPISARHHPTALPRNPRSRVHARRRRRLRVCVRRQRGAVR